MNTEPEGWTAPLVAGLSRVRRSSLVRSSGVYGVSTVLNRAIPFLLLPVLTRYLSPEDFGKAAMFTVAVNLTLPFVGFTTDSAIGRQYFERDRIDFGNYVTNCLYVLGVTGAIALAAALLFPGPIGTTLELPAGWVWSIVLTAAARFVVATVLTLWQVQNRPAPYLVFSFLQTALTFGLSIVFIVWAGLGWQGRVLGELVSVTAFALAGAVVLWRGGWIRPGLNGQYIKHAMRFSGWLLPHLYASVLMSTTDRLFLTHIAGVAETGLYAVAAQIAMVIAVVGQSFNLAWSPWAYERLKLNDQRSRASVTTARRWYNVGIVVLALLLALVTPLVFGPLVGPAFAGAAKFALWLALGQAFVAMYSVAVTPLFFANKTHLLAILSLTVAAISVMFNYVLISVNGPVGAAQANALSLFILYVAAVPLAGHVMRQVAHERRDERPGAVQAIR